MTGRTAYGRACSASLPNSSDSRARSGSSQIALTNGAPSSAAASSTGVNSAGRGRDRPDRRGHGRSLIASTSSTAIPVSARRRAVSASMAEPGVIGHGRSSSVAGETRKPTAPNPAAALSVTSSGGATPSSVRCSSPATRVTAASSRAMN